MFNQKFCIFCIAALLFVLVISPSWAVETGRLTGRITDTNSGESLPTANVVITGINVGLAADNNGRFGFKNIPVGKYTVKVSRIGYSSVEEQVQIRANQISILNVTLAAEAVKFREVIVTATRDKALTSEVAVATEIITRAKMEQSNSQNIGEVLENATGLFVKNYGHIGALKTASIRGASENQVLILLDGQRLNQAQGLAPDLSDIPLQAIERVEVIRGGHSALYGTGAVGGVINLITRSSSGQETVSGEVNSTIASFGTRIVEASFSQKLGAVDYFIAHNYTAGDGNFEFEDPQGQTVERTNNNVKWNDTFLKLRYSFNPSAVISGYFQFHDADRGVPGPLSFPSETARQQDKSWKYNFRYEQQFAPNFNLHAHTFLYKFKQNFDDPNAFFPILSQHKNDAFGLNLQSNWRATNFHEITGGYEFREDKINSTDVSSQKRTNHSLYLQDQIKLSLQENWYLSFVPAFRLDKFTDVNAQFSPKMGFVFNYISKVQMGLRGSWGRSYRIPSFNDLFWPAGSFTAGNPNLFPEKGVGFDIGYSLNFKESGFWGLEINYFNTSLDNLILWGPRDDGVWSPQNVQKANISGIETQILFQGLGDLVNFQADYTYLDAVDDSDAQGLNGNHLIYRPKHKVDLNLNFDFDRFQLNGVYHYISKRFTNTDNSGSLGSYSLTNLSTSWKQPVAGRHFKLQFEVRNIFDKQIQVIEGFPVPGREYRTSFGFRF